MGELRIIPTIDSNAFGNGADDDTHSAAAPIADVPTPHACEADALSRTHITDKHAAIIRRLMIDCGDKGGQLASKVYSGIIPKLILDGADAVHEGALRVMRNIARVEPLQEHQQNSYFLAAVSSAAHDILSRELLAPRNQGDLAGVPDKTQDKEDRANKIQYAQDAIEEIRQYLSGPYKEKLLKRSKAREIDMTGAIEQVMFHSQPYAEVAKAYSISFDSLRMAVFHFKTKVREQFPHHDPLLQD